MARIGIVTRVHASRHDLVPRAAASLAAQSLTDWDWVLVAHGSASGLEHLVAGFDEEIRLRTRVVDSGLDPDQHANGMLLNRGLEALDTEYLICFDEDDSWDPQALELLLAAVEDSPFASVAGAVCQSRRILEEACPGGWPVESDREDLNPALVAITLAELALENRFTNHALLLRREVALDLGGWDEDLPLLVDWEFNLRLLAQYDLEVVPEVLANYHQRRDQGRGGGNISHTIGGNRRETARAVIVNRFLRDPAAPPGLREALAAGAANFELREEVRRCFRKLRVVGERVGRIDSRSKELKNKFL